jgi:ABC-2 type transport system ATP-binding protein
MSAAVQFNQVSKRFGDLLALDNINLTIQPGEFFALLGPNGAGKSTMINLLSGLLHPTAGSVQVMGYDVIKQYRQARRSLGVVPQELVFDPFFTLREMLLFQAGYFGKRSDNNVWIDEVIEGLGLSDKANTNMRRLSGGMKRRALIAQALVHKPPVIVLDEPTAGVDVELRYMLWEFIKRLNQQGHTIILTTHYLEEAEELCSRVALVKQGKIIKLETTKNLLHTVQGKLLQLKLSGELPPALKPLLREKNADGYLLNIAEISALENVLSIVRQANIGIEDMRLIERDLEDVFVELVGQA